MLESGHSADLGSQLYIWSCVVEGTIRFANRDILAGCCVRGVGVSAGGLLGRPKERKLLAGGLGEGWGR